jgi:hypothetical protein
MLPTLSPIRAHVAGAIATRQAGTETDAMDAIPDVGVTIEPCELCGAFVRPWGAVVASAVVPPPPQPVNATPAIEAAAAEKFSPRNL